MNAHIATLPGDGIGPEVTAEAVLALQAIARRFGHTFRCTEHPIGGVAIDLLETPLPDETLQACRAADAVLFGAVGGPRWDDPDAPVRPEQGLLAIRRELNLFANLRPVLPHPRLAAASPLRPERLVDVDLVVVRELTGGIYFGRKWREPAEHGGERAFDLCAYETHEIERIARIAATLALARGGLLTSIDKANVLETSRLWRAVVTRVVRDEFPAVTLEHMLVDACAMQLMLNPARFDVIVTENMFGDILTDEAAVLAGSIGVLPSASLGPRRRVELRPHGLYEPIHGSAPDIAGRGTANPIGAILSAALLLRHSLELETEAVTVERAVRAVLDAGIMTPDINRATRDAATTREVGAAVAAYIETGLITDAAPPVRAGSSVL